MSWQRWWLAVGLSAAIGSGVSSARAENDACSQITRSNVVDCVLRASAAREAARSGVDAAEGRVRANDPWFPSSPTLGITAARRTAGAESAMNWSATLGVELEVSGARQARRDSATADKQAEANAATSVERAAAAEAWIAYFETIGAGEEVALLRRLEGASDRVREAARAGAAKGSLPGVESDLAEAAYLRVVRRRIDAQRDAERARGELAALLGREQGTEIVVTGTLAPLADAERVDLRVAPDPPEARALEARSRAFSARAVAQRRGRFPTPTLSAFVERDGFNENVLGVGLALPLPLPEPVGRMNGGEIAESEALARQAKLLATDSRRHNRALLLQALASYASAREATDLYTSERLERAEATLSSLANEVEAARIGVRDAVLLQEPLLDLLNQAVEARRALCRASVDLARAAGIALEDGGPR